MGGGSGGTCSLKLDFLSFFLGGGGGGEGVGVTQKPLFLGMCVSNASKPALTPPPPPRHTNTLSEIQFWPYIEKISIKHGVTLFS